MLPREAAPELVDDLEALQHGVGVARAEVDQARGLVHAGLDQARDGALAALDRAHERAALEVALERDVEQVLDHVRGQILRRDLVPAADRSAADRGELLETQRARSEER